MLLPQFPPELHSVVLAGGQLRFQMRNERVELAGLRAFGGPLWELAGRYKASHGVSAELETSRDGASADSLGVELPHLRGACLSAGASLLALLRGLVQ